MEEPLQFARRIQNELEKTQSYSTAVGIIEEAIRERDSLIWDCGYRDHGVGTKQRKAMTAKKP